MLAFRGSIVPHPPFAGQDLRVVAQAAVQPRDGVAHLEPGILDGAGEAVPGAGASEREEVPTWFEDPQGFTRPLLAPGAECMIARQAQVISSSLGGCRPIATILPRFGRWISGVLTALRGGVGDEGGIPRLTHEPDAVWRVCHHSVNTGLGHGSHHLDAVAVVQGHPLVLVVDRHRALTPRRFSSRFRRAHRSASRLILASEGTLVRSGVFRIPWSRGPVGGSRRVISAVILVSSARHFGSFTALHSARFRASARRFSASFLARTMATLTCLSHRYGWVAGLPHRRSAESIQALQVPSDRRSPTATIEASASALVTAHAPGVRSCAACW